MSRLLLVEDDVSLGQTLTERLERNNYEVAWAKNLASAREKARSEHFDLIILDVGLPDGSGFDFAKEVRQARKAPFIFMTAMATAPNRLQGFELGAEEFIPKPFHLKELFLRIKHVLENHAPKKALHLGRCKIDFEKMAITDGKGHVEYLAARDFQLLEMLINASPRVLSRDEIIEALWGEEKFPTNRTVDNVIVRLRQLLGDEGRHIRSVRGIGYQWLEEVDNG